MSAPGTAPGVLGPERVPDALRAAGLDPRGVLEVVDGALREDLALGPDVTTDAILPAGARGSASVVARGDGRLAGIPVAAAVVHRLARAQRVVVDGRQ